MAQKKHKWKLVFLWFKRIIKILLALLLTLVVIAIFSFRHLFIFVPDTFKLIGFPFQTRNYLLIAQNDAELRPTGGFASAYALIKFRSGVVQVEMHDVYGAIDDHPYVEPPYPYGDLLKNENYAGHSFRDANVYADFPSSAEEFIKFFNINNPDVKIDGVVSINYDILEDIVGVLGQIEVKEMTLNESNLFETIEHEVNNIDRHDIEQIYTRKQFLQPVLYGLIKKSVSSPLKWADMSETIKQALDDKKIQLYFRDSHLEQKYQKKAWTGDWPKPDDNDFFAVVDTNLGGMKSNRYINREISRVLNFDEQEAGQMSLSADVDVKINHLGVDYIPISGDYTGFIRFYTPEGSDFKGESPEGMWRYFENGYTVFAKRISLKPGENTHVMFSYNLPQNINSTYNLFVPRQSSTNDFYSLSFRAPRGFGLLGDKTSNKENLATWRNNLNANLQLAINVKPDTLAPLIVFQKMLNLTTATVHFNEAVKLPITPGQLELIDLNFNNPQTDKPKIISIDADSTDSRYINITIDGLTEQVEERYKLKLKDIEDVHGNIMSPNPTEITLIQRNLSWIK